MVCSFLITVEHVAAMKVSWAMWFTIRLGEHSRSSKGWVLGSLPSELGHWG